MSHEKTRMDPEPLASQILVETLGMAEGTSFIFLKLYLRIRRADGHSMQLVSKSIGSLPTPRQPQEIGADFDSLSIPHT